ncbi:TRAP transporter small permease [Falsihalocynthiibacter arcticus]|uniref:TRAP transporter small permease protein n=1 Tax=Falsihalocynthiibacter arcticus TaxID=1579316 RepID=A0A126UYM6_9RHOB|nr:TRAP transporter small permease subunit [Falsihalocynthiibacter arcticus]AML51168.1 C4-dicarboxylate ABC transporter permease [Falsihalocynthiibacter arcticus]
MKNLILKIADRLEEYVCSLIFLVMTFIGFANVLVRYLSNYSFAATQEILLNGFLLLTVFGAAIAARRGQHLAVTLFADMLPAALQPFVRWFSVFLGVLLLVLSAWYCGEMVMNQRASGIVSAGLQVPSWYYSLALPLGFLMIAVRLVQGAIIEQKERAYV